VGLGGAIILMSLFAVPYYLLRSRPPGQKGRTLLRFVGFCLLCIVVNVVAQMAVVLLRT
jgi:hypothetical protein